MLLFFINTSMPFKSVLDTRILCYFFRTFFLCLSNSQPWYVYILFFFLFPDWLYVVKQKCTTANVVIYSDIPLFLLLKNLLLIEFSFIIPLVFLIFSPCPKYTSLGVRLSNLQSALRENISIMAYLSFLGESLKGQKSPRAPKRLAERNKWRCYH